MTTKYQRPTGTHSGNTGLSNRDKYQTDASTQPKVAISSSKMDGDFNYIVDALNEIDEAAGSASSIQERLNISLNLDGSLKASASSVMDDWIEHDISGLTRVNDNTITCDDDQTSIYVLTRRVRLIVDGNPLFANLESSSFTGGVTTLTFTEIVNGNAEVATIATAPSSISFSPIMPGAIGNAINKFNAMNLNSLQLKNDDAIIILTDTGVSGKSYGIRSISGNFEIVENTGTEESPTWVVRTTVDSNGLLITDGSITPEKMSDAGTVGQILTSNGTGNAPSYQDSISNGVWEIVQTQDITTAVSEVSFSTSITDNTTHKFIFEGVHADSSGRNLEAKFKTSGVSHNMAYAQQSINTIGTASYNGNEGLNPKIRMLSGISYGIVGELMFNNIKELNSFFSGKFSLQAKNSSGTNITAANLNHGSFATIVKDTSIDEIVFYPSSGTLNRGKITHLKLKE